MGIIRELGEFLEKVKPWETVREYQQGLMYRLGYVIEKKLKLTPGEKEEEKELTGGVFGDFPFLRKKLPDGWKRRFQYFGAARHPNRYKKEKTLRPGFYVFLPPFYEVEKTSVQDRAIDLKNISVLTGPNGSNVILEGGENPSNGGSINLEEISKSRDPTKIKEVLEKSHWNLIISCNMIYNVRDFYKAFNKVDDYETSLKRHTLSLLAKESRKMSCFDWLNSGKIEELEKRVVDQVRKKATENWGLKIQGIYITENVPHNVQRLFHEGGIYVPQGEELEEE